MKKLLCVTAVALCVVMGTGCGKTVKSDSMDMVVEMPEGGWKVESDENDSFVISKKNNLITYTDTEVPEGYTIPKTQEELAAIIGEEVMALSTIDDWEYNDDESNPSLFYVQTLTAGEEQTILINKYVISNGKLKTAMATLTDSKKVDEIKEIIKNY